MLALPVRMEAVNQGEYKTLGFVCTRCLKVPSRCGCKPVELKWNEAKKAN